MLHFFVLIGVQRSTWCIHGWVETGSFKFGHTECLLVLFFLLPFICDHYSWKVAWNGISHFLHQACGNQMKHVSKTMLLVCFVMIHCWCKVWTYNLCGHSFSQNDCKLEILNRMHLRFSRFLKPTPFTFLNKLADFFREADEAMIKKHSTGQSAELLE